MRLLASQLRTPGPIVAARVSDRLGYHPEQRAAQAPLYWPRHQGGRTRMARIDPAQIPPGWQSLGAHVPARPATCEETDCPMFLRGWTEIVPPDGSGTVPKAGELSPDDAAQITGYYGAASLPPQVIHHPPGTTCGRIHKIAQHAIPPLYTVNGRVVLWNQFEDAIGGGLHHAQQLVRDGRY